MAYKYPIPFNIMTPVDQRALDNVHLLPEWIRKWPALMDCLLRLAPRIYRSPGICQIINPYYKIEELLERDKLYYSDLKLFEEYYFYSISQYLIKNELTEFYVGEICRNEHELKRALSPENNITDRYTLARILSTWV